MRVSAGQEFYLNFTFQYICNNFFFWVLFYSFEQNLFLRFSCLLLFSFSSHFYLILASCFFLFSYVLFFPSLFYHLIFHGFFSYFFMNWFSVDSVLCVFRDICCNDDDCDDVDSFAQTRPTVMTTMVGKGRLFCCLFMFLLLLVSLLLLLSLSLLIEAVGTLLLLLSILLMEPALARVSLRLRFIQDPHPFPSPWTHISSLVLYRLISIPVFQYLSNGTWELSWLH